MGRLQLTSKNELNVVTRVGLIFTFRDVEATVGQGEVKELKAMDTYKKCRCQLRSFLFINNVDLNNNNVKTILNFLDARIAATNLFQVDLDKPWN